MRDALISVMDEITKSRMASLLFPPSCKEELCELMSAGGSEGSHHVISNVGSMQRYIFNFDLS